MTVGTKIDHDVKSCHLNDDVKSLEVIVKDVFSNLKNVVEYALNFQKNDPGLSGKINVLI